MWWKRNKKPVASFKIRPLRLNHSKWEIVEQELFWGWKSPAVIRFVDGKSELNLFDSVEIAEKMLKKYIEYKEWIAQPEVTTNVTEYDEQGNKICEK